MLSDPDLPRLLERRRGRGRAGGRPQERDRDRRRDRGRPRLRPEHPVAALITRGLAEIDATRGGARRAAPRPSPASPVSATSCSPAPGELSRNRKARAAPSGSGKSLAEAVRRDLDGGRGRAHHPGRLRPGRAGAASRCPSPSRCRRCSTRASLRARRRSTSDDAQPQKGVEFNVPVGLDPPQGPMYRLLYQDGDVPQSYTFTTGRGR